ncbi:Splicing factor 45 [Labeo rohita]|uniref:Splicing factor 45 n=1 Tax=Labeo rohita TaxID=84645 RepID=A0ABQ8MSY9_LABRO|nr:Splicing factor 45 [Labeo rohita]
MSLYDDLGVATSDTKTEGWSKNFKLLQSQLKVKKAALTQAKTQRMRQSNVLAPVIDLKRGSAVDDRQISDTPPHIAAGMKDSSSAGFSSGDVLIPLADEYDPMFPNDYEKVVKRHREERQRQREQERQKEIEEREKKRKERHEGGGGGAPSGFSRFPTEGESDEEEEYEREKRKRSMGGAAIAPPTSLVERDTSFSYDEDGRQSGTVAHKIMQKYGFRDGQGLGKHEQGLSTALSVEKTSKRGGKIIIGDSTEKTSGSSQNVADPHGSNSADASKKNEANPLTEILKCPTKVVLLRNMVGRGEVDEDLEAETKEECEKYGKVVKCVIFEFERVESAIKAVVDLNGRYFGGRVVKACFYNLDKFRVLDLGDQV